MNSTWSVLTTPYLVVTDEPSTMGNRSRWTPSRDTSGPPPDEREPATLSISSMKTMPDCSARSMASAVTLSMSMSFCASSLVRSSMAWGIFTFFDF